MTRLLTTWAAAGGLLLLSPLAAHAIPTYCVPGGNDDGLTVSDVTFRGADADNCYGVVNDNDTASNIGFSGFSELLKSDEGGTGSFSGVDFTLTGTGGLTSGTSGSWTLSWADPSPTDLPLSLDFTVVLKGANYFASYLFLDELLEASPNSGSGTWEINFVKNDNLPALSHMSLYVKGGTTTRVPEPAPLALLGLGLMGFGFVRLRSTRATN